MKHYATLLGIVLVACSDGPVAPPVNPDTVAVDLSVQLVALDASAAMIVEGTRESITVHGSLLTGTHGYELRASLVADGTLALFVIADLRGGITIPAHYRYQVQLSPLPVGRHRLVIVHRIPDEHYESTAFDGFVQVT